MWAGVVAWIVVEFTTITPVAALPAPRSAKATLAGDRKLVPVMVTAVPPFAGPLVGVMLRDRWGRIADDGEDALVDRRVHLGPDRRG